MQDVFVVSGKRTPIGDFLGTMKDLSNVDLGKIAAKAAMEQVGFKPEQVEHVVTGCVFQGGAKGNVSRQIQLGVNIPVEVGAVTVNQLCSSSMRAAEVGADMIRVGRVSNALIVGAESMTNAPYVLHKARAGYRMGPGKIEDTMLYDGLVDAFYNYHMGVTTENVNAKYGNTREEQDQLSVISHQRAAAATKNGTFKEEMVPVEIKTKKGVTIFDYDEHVKADTTMESLAKLKPAFKPDGGTVTAGNASGVNDGAAAALFMSGDALKNSGLKPMAKILASATVGVDPSIMGVGPAYSIPQALKFAGLDFKDIGYWEVNEAFAGQWLGVGKILKADHKWDLSLDICNANGSGIALGHPVGQTGLRLIVSGIYEAKRRGVKYLGTSLCVGGGPSMATILEIL